MFCQLLVDSPTAAAVASDWWAGLHSSLPFMAGYSHPAEAEAWHVRVDSTRYAMHALYAYMMHNSRGHSRKFATRLDL